MQVWWVIDKTAGFLKVQVNKPNLYHQTVLSCWLLLVTQGQKKKKKTLSLSFQ